MARNRVFRESDVEAIVKLIRDWPKDRISWNDVCKNSEAVLGFVPSRQGLSQHENIRTAFRAKKDRLHVSPQQSSPMPSSLAVAAKRIARLKAEIDELARENTLLKDRLITWQYNAHTHNMTQADLDKPLAEVDREIGKSERDAHGRRK